jgi:hypothetical protein
MKCETCMYWDPEHQTKGEGLCRRNPPIMDIPWILSEFASSSSGNQLETLINEADNAIWWAWPTTVDNAWCGEYKEIGREGA